MEKIMRIALFGGSFNPVTNAHRDIAERLNERFDKVVVMPAAVSPFKQGERLESAEHRVQMLKRAMRGLENVKVSRYEVKKEGVSYTVDTLKHIKKKAGECEIYTVIGSEELPFLDKWNNAEELKNLTVFYVVERPKFPVTIAMVERAELYGFKVRTAPFCGMDVSSSEVKLCRAFGRENLPVPKSAAKYIEKNSLYNDYRFITERYAEFGLKRERIEHTERVARAAVSLAKRFGVNVSDALTAALLHDIGKETEKEWFALQGLEPPIETADMPPQIRHAAYGAAIAENCFGIENADILEAIRLHTTGDAKMSKLAQVVFLADGIEEGRDGEEAEKVRLTLREGLTAGMAEELKANIEYLKSRGMEIYPRMIKARDYFVRLKIKEEKEAAEGITEQEAKPKKKPAEKKSKAKKAEQILPETSPQTAEEKTGNELETVPDAPKAKKNASKEQPDAEKSFVAGAAPNAEQAEAFSEKPKAAEAETINEPPEQPKTHERTRAAAIDNPHEKAHDLAYTIAQYLNEKKASDVTLIDIASRTIIADYFVIASASSTTQVRALAEYVDEKLSKGYGMEPLHRDVDAKWYVVDYGNVIVHVFYEEFRNFYQLERLWSDGTNVEKVNG